MKKTTLIILMVTLIASFGFAQTQTPVLTVSATVTETPLSATATQSITMGDVSKNSTVTIGADGTGHANAGTPLEGIVTLGGEGAAVVTVSYDATATLTDVTDGTNSMTFTPVVTGHATTQAAAPGVASGNTITLDGAAGATDGQFIFWVGGSMPVGIAQVPDSYSTANTNGAPWTMTLAYQ